MRPVLLSERTSLGLGGWARHLEQPDTDEAVRDVLAMARRHALPLAILGGGSNLVVADSGWPGILLEPSDRSLEIERDLEAIDPSLRIRAGAGLAWEAVVDAAVDAGAGGIECLSGIPGSVGAAPIQNIGAYGQELSTTVVRVHAVDRRSGESVALAAADCGFGYRASHFKGGWRDRFVITAVEFRLPLQVAGSAEYPPLRERLGLTDGMASPSLAAVRAAVRDLRREKAMLLDGSAPAGTPSAGRGGDPRPPHQRPPDQRSAGSFFVNPVVSPAEADAVAERAAARGATRSLPRYPTPSGDTKLSAAWLIEEAGFHRGWGADFRGGRARLSTRHTLALTNFDNAQATDLVALAAHLRAGVRDAFGVTLVPEPVFLGFERSVSAVLDQAAKPEEAAHRSHPLPSRTCS